MNATARLIIAGALLALAAPAFSASPQAHSDCDAADPDRNIAGCTRIIDDLSEGAHMRSIALVGRALAYEAKGDVDRAIADFDAAIRLDADDAEAHRQRARLFLEKHDLDRAAADLDATIRLDPGRAFDHYVRGVIRYDRYTYASPWIEQSDLDGAIADLSEAIRLAPRDTRPYRARALAWRTDGRRDRFIADMVEAARLNPSDTTLVASVEQLAPSAHIVAGDPVSDEYPLELGAKFHWDRH